MNTLYTIGYSCFTIDSFISALKNHDISAVVDVRSTPFSRFKPDFNRDNIKLSLNNEDITYVFLGEQCGARTDAPDCYLNGKVSYAKLAENAEFKNGLGRIMNGMNKYKVALMCAEKDPISCHRAILISKNIQSKDVLIKHILENGDIEEHSKSELRLMKLYGLDQEDLFNSFEDRLSDAYEQQAKKIAYAEETTDEEWLTT